MSNGILVFIEHKNDVVNKSSLETIAAAQTLGAQLQQAVTLVVPGSEAVAQDVAVFDVVKVIHASNEKLGEYTPDAYADALEQIVKQVDPGFVFMTHTYQVRDFAPKLAARDRKSVV